jgi:ATP-binding cassette, subfamily B (MDR/TAP), member 1
MTLSVLPTLIGLNGWIQMKFIQGFSADAKVFLALTMAAIGVSHTSTLTSDSSRAKSAVSSIFAIVGRKSRTDPSDESGVSLEPLNGGIEFRHVRFRYPIFEDLCLTIQSGKVLTDLVINF